jgi:1-acyl-sn-glycerol-3-phosphate acyltransferase
VSLDNSSEKPSASALLALKLGRRVNESDLGKRSQELFLRSVSYSWMRAVMKHRTFIEGLDTVAALRPPRGVLLAANHRSYFDLYAITTVVFAGPTPWAQRLTFPVRSNFFYDSIPGIFLNFLVGGGAMYPPIYRDVRRAGENKQAVRGLVDMLQQPGAMVGMHPEGGRSKLPSPYEMLPAQPGSGQLALLAQPTIIPVFINGLTNNLGYEIKTNWIRDIRKNDPMICVFGAPLDYADLSQQKPRPALYSVMANRIRDSILLLAERERELRAQAAAGDLADDHPGWFANRRAGKLYAARR